MYSQHGLAVTVQPKLVCTQGTFHVLYLIIFRLMPEDATVDEDGVQLGGKRAAILYAHRLRQAEAEAAAEAAKAAEAAPPVADAEEEAAVKADAEAEGGEQKESILANT